MVPVGRTHVTSSCLDYEGLPKRMRDICRTECQVIDLTTDEVAIEPTGSVREGAIAALNAGTNHYTDFAGLTPLRSAIAEKLAAQTGVCWNTEEIIVTASASQALCCATLAMLDPGDETIIIRPYGPTFPFQVLLAGATPVFVDARRPRYVPDINAIRAAVTSRTKAIIINSPNNPTGAVYDRTTLQKIGELAISAGLWIISDERYSRFIFTRMRRHESIIMAQPEARSRTIVVNAFSKELGITGWHSGYFAAPAEIASAARKLLTHATASVTAEHAILHHHHFRDCSFERQLYQRIVDARSAGLHVLSDLRDVAPPRADGSLFFYLDLSRLVSALPTEGHVQSGNDIARLLLDEAHVGCVSGGVFGDVSGLRISFGAPPELLKAGLERIVKVLNSLRARQAGWSPSP